MKILVLSDSHGQMAYMERAWELEEPETVIHLGDHDTDAQELARFAEHTPVLFVRGNCDFLRSTPKRLLVSLEGVRLLLMHGHEYGVKSGYLQAELAAREAGAQVLLFGHTHIPYCEWHNGLWMLNPGSCSGRGRITYGVMELKDGTASCRIKELTIGGEQI